MLGNQAKSELVKSQVADAPRNRSNFNLSYHHYSTLRFAEVSPFFEIESVGGDKIILRSEHKLSTFTLKSPILSDVHLNKDYFNVPIEAILPFNWDKIYTNPVVGDDVVAKDCNTIFSSPSGSDKTATYEPFAKLMLLYLIYGKSGILSRFGISVSSLLSITGYDKKNYDIDTYVEKLFNEIYQDLNDKPFYVVYYDEEASYKTKRFDALTSRSSLRSFMRFCLNHCVFSIHTDGVDNNILIPKQPNSLNFIDYTFSFTNPASIDVNIAPVFAYQLVCAHYYTSDRVDYIYSAELYRQLLKSFITNVSFENGSAEDTFVYNGVYTFYDYCSGHYINKFFQNCILVDSNSYDVQSVSAFYYLQNIFKINRSLRYSDFFTGAKVRPLAVGDVAIEVNQNAVSAVDVTRNIQAQRFLNFVNRVGRKFEEYVGKLSGVYVKPDFHNPQYLGATKELLFNSKLENTASEQWKQPNSVTSQYIGNSKDYAFEFESDRPSIVLGLISFDIERAYNKSINPEAYHIDRFDYFNPFMQHIGDQEIPLACYDVSLIKNIGDTTFGYQTRHAEYKEKFSFCDGGFVDGSLPSWLFLNKPSDEKVISPEVIRSYPEEFDEFYLMLDGLTSDYFHFIVDFYNICNASRPMIKSPNIL